MRPSKFFETLLASLLAMLGFSSCDSDKPDCMYGTPTGHFEVKGVVTDQAGKPVEDAEVVAKDLTGYDDDKGVYETLERTHTLSNGNYTLTGAFFSFGGGTLRIVCLPPEGSGLAADSTDVELKYVSSEDGWNMGNYTATVNFKLKPETPKD